MATDAASGRAAAMQRAGQGDIVGAIDVLRELVEDADDPEDRLLLGRMAFVATDYAEAQVQLERAYRDFQSRGLPRRAAMAATALANLHFAGLDETVVARGWRARALGLLERERPCVELGYALLGPTGASVASAEDLEADAGTALEIARRFNDRNLECKALGDAGLALASMGRLTEGMARLDEAFTMIAGGDCRDPSIISQVMCNMLSACDRCGDVVRAESWVRFLEHRASDRSSEGAPAHTFAHCWSAFGSVLCQVGRWTEAETALRMALTRGESSFSINRLQSRAALADLWIRQGRLDEASALIDHNADRVEVMGARARLYLAEGRYERAAAVARQALRELIGDRLRAGSLLLCLAEAEIGADNLDAADDTAGQLARLSEGAEPPVLAAQASLARGKVAAARGDLTTAIRRFDEGITVLQIDNWPLVRGTLHLELAQVQVRNADAEAIVHAEAALSIFRRIGAPEAAAAVELLRTLGIPVEDAVPLHTALDVLSPREREVISLLAEGLSNPEIGERLFISAKTAEHHVGSILRKLGLRNRAEAAAFAASFRTSPDRRVRTVR